MAAGVARQGEDRDFARLAEVSENGGVPGLPHWFLILCVSVQGQSPITPRGPLGQDGKPTPAPQRLSIETDRVEAIVNEQVITKSEIDLLLEPQRQAAGILDPAKLAELRRNELLRLTREALLTQAAKRMRVDEASVEQTLKEILEEETRKAGGKAQLRHNLEGQGRTLADYEREIRNEILIARLRASEYGLGERPENEIAITPSMLRAYYRENLDRFRSGPAVHGRQLWVSDGMTGARKATLQKVRELRSQIQAPEDFDRATRTYSTAPLPGRARGDMGWVQRSSSVHPAIIEFLFSHEPGAISEPIELENAVVLVRVEEKRPAGLRPFEDPETQRDISGALLDSKRELVLRSLYRRLLSEAYIWPDTIRLMLGGV